MAGSKKVLICKVLLHWSVSSKGWRLSCRHFFFRQYLRKDIEDFPRISLLRKAVDCPKCNRLAPALMQIRGFRTDTASYRQAQWGCPVHTEDPFLPPISSAVPPLFFAGNNRCSCQHCFYDYPPKCFPPGTYQRSRWPPKEGARVRLRNRRRLSLLKAEIPHLLTQRGGETLISITDY